MLIFTSISSIAFVAVFVFIISTKNLMYINRKVKLKNDRKVDTGDRWLYSIFSGLFVACTILFLKWLHVEGTYLQVFLSMVTPILAAIISVAYVLEKHK